MNFQCENAIQRDMVVQFIYILHSLVQPAQHISIVSTVHIVTVSVHGSTSLYRICICMHKDWKWMDLNELVDENVNGNLYKFVFNCFFLPLKIMSFGIATFVHNFHGIQLPVTSLYLCKYE